MIIVGKIVVFGRLMSAVKPHLLAIQQDSLCFYVNLPLVGAATDHPSLESLYQGSEKRWFRLMSNKKPEIIEPFRLPGRGEYAMTFDDLALVRISL